MGVRIDTSGVMHDLAATDIDVAPSNTLDNSGYTTPPPPTQGTSRGRTMQASYSDVSDGTSDGEDMPPPPPTVKTTTPVLKTATTQASTSIFKRIQSDARAGTVRLLL